MFRTFSMKDDASKFVPKALGIALVAGLMVSPVWAQPDPPETPDIACSAIPDANGEKDTVVSTPDSEGFYNIFDGTSKGWWHSCLTVHSNGSPLGAIFKYTTIGTEPAIYSNDRNNSIGGILMTKKKYRHYEIIFDFWPDFGNDGGVFNRTTAQGNCPQTVLDYISTASVGGWWSEAFQPGRDVRPWRYGANENSISIEAGPNGWTAITAKNNPQSYGCAATGCVAADYTRLWDVNGWNQMRIKFYGGSQSGEGPLQMRTWFRKLGSTAWVPILADTTLDKVVPPGYIGLQVHNGNRFQGPKGSWYKNIKVRELDFKGVPPVSVVARKRPEARFAYEVKAVGSIMSGSIDSDYEMVVKDLNGKQLENFRGRAGSFSHTLTSDTFGWMMVQMKTPSGVETTRILRVRD